MKCSLKKLEDTSRASYLKYIILGVAILTSSLAVADSVALGAANVTACNHGGGLPQALKEAETQAKNAADEDCSNFGFYKAEQVEIQILSEYRGYCWAGTSSGVAIKLKYICK